MSCQIKGIANISDVDNVKKLLYGDTVNKCKFFNRYDAMHSLECINILIQVHFFQSSMMNYLFKTVLYHCHQLEMYLRWLGIQR